MQNTKKLDSLTSLRFFAAAMIVLGHGHGLFGSMGLATTYSLAQGGGLSFLSCQALFLHITIQNLLHLPM